MEKMKVIITNSTWLLNKHKITIIRKNTIIDETISKIYELKKANFN